jgi:benzoate membrane transport protein
MLEGRADNLHEVTAGVVTSLVGFTGAFAVVLAGLRAVGATPAQAASGLLTVTVLMGACSLLLSVWTRIPVVVAWSTPGAALLISTGASHGGWPAAVGAFALCGVLLALVGLWARLGRWIALIPGQVAAAMLRVARRWAAPIVMVVAFGLSYTSSSVRSIGVGELAPHLAWTTPALSVAALVSIALPLFAVTMASQNIPGVAVLASFGYLAPVACRGGDLPRRGVRPDRRRCRGGVLGPGRGYRRQLADPGCTGAIAWRA